MDVNYGLSLWNFFHHNFRDHEGGLPELRDVLTDIKRFGYCGVELWRRWKGLDIFEPDTSKAVFGWCNGLRRSLHTQNVKGFDEHKEQIDGAQRCGVEVIVLHPTDLCDFVEGRDSGDKCRPNIPLARDIVRYASDRNIVLALENVQKPGLEFLVEAIENVGNLRVCLDVGHVYLDPDGENPGKMERKSLAEYLDKLGQRLAHLHIQDVLPEAEKVFPDAGQDHYTPGTGTIPESDWRLLFNTLESLSFDGLAMLEILPRKPFLQGNLALQFLDKMRNSRK